MSDAAVRLLECLRSPLDAEILGPGIVREIVYRALCGPQGHLLLAMVGRQGQAAQINAALRWIHSRYAEPFSVARHGRRSRHERLGVSSSVQGAHGQLSRAVPEVRPPAQGPGPDRQRGLGRRDGRDRRRLRERVAVQPRVQALLRREPDAKRRVACARSWPSRSRSTRGPPARGSRCANLQHRARQRQVSVWLSQAGAVRSQRAFPATTGMLMSATAPTSSPLPVRLFVGRRCARRARGRPRGATSPLGAVLHRPPRAAGRRCGDRDPVLRRLPFGSAPGARRMAELDLSDRARPRDRRPRHEGRQRRDEVPRGRPRRRRLHGGFVPALRAVCRRARAVLRAAAARRPTTARTRSSAGPRSAATPRASR